MGKPMNLRAAAGLAIFLLAGCVAGGGLVHDANVQWTPLHEAVLSGDVATIRSLLAGDANVNARGKEGATPLHLAAVLGDAVAIRSLLAGDANVNARGKEGATPLHLAAMSGDAVAIRSLLTGGANINARAKDGVTPLHVAALSGDAVAIRSLLTGGANINARAKDGVTPLHVAALSGDAAAIRALLAGGADVNARDEVGFTPLHRAATKKLLLAVLETDAKGSRDKLLRMVRAAGFDALAETDREVLAAILKDSANDGAAAVHALLAGGAAVNARSKDGFTPLHVAAFSGDAAAVKALLDAGGDPNAVASGCRPMDMAQSRMESTEGSVAPFRDSIAALRAAGGQPRKGCRF